MPEGNGPKPGPQDLSPRDRKIAIGITAQAEQLPRPDVPIKDSWVKGFLRGTKRWPESNGGINILTSIAIVNDPPTDWVAFSQSRLSKEQISEVNKAKSDPPKGRYTPLATVEHAQDENPILPEESLPDIWEDVVQDNVLDTVVGFVDLVKPPTKRQLRSPQEKAQVIQAFFDDPGNNDSIGTLTDVLEAANEALVTPDSLALSDFYKASLTGNETFTNLRDQYRARYQDTFDNGVTFDDEPARGTWNLAAHNVRTALTREFPGQDISWLELETGDEMTPWFRGTDALPAAVRAADAAPPESVLAINPDSLTLPGELKTNTALLSVLYGDHGLRADFLRYYATQVERSKYEEFPIQLDPQESFEEDVNWFGTFTDTVTRAVERHPGGKVLFFLDCDEFAGKTDEKSDPIQAGGLEKIDLQDLSQEQEDDLKAIHVTDAVNRFVFRPAFPHAVNWARGEYPDQVEFYMLSTKPQQILNELEPKLEALCPDAFTGRVLSSRDGAAERIIPEIVQRESGSARAKDMSLREALDTFLEASPADRTFVPERIIKANEGSGRLTEYDQKLFIIIRRLEERREAIEALKGSSPDTKDDAELQQSLPLEVAAVLLEDGSQTAASSESALIEHVLTPRFRFPDDLDDITGEDITFSNITIPDDIDEM